MDLYSQLPLSESHPEIRVLYIHPPEQSDEPLSCDLRVISLDDNLEYSALSYVWGETVLDHSLRCNDHELPVTGNLYRALRAVRNIGKDLIIWADQVCINQDETAILERTAQVARMGQVYSKAAKVLVWLGEATEATKTIKMYVIWIWLQVYSEDESPEIKSRLTKAGLGDLTPGQLANIRQGWHQWLRLFERPWFSRIWVLQEAIRAQITQIIIGDEEVGPEHFLKIVYYWLIKHESDDVTNAPADFEENGERDSPDHLESGRSSETIDLVRTWRLIDQGYSKGRAELIDLLRGCRRFRATDSRDKIYALLGLCADETEVPSPDYAMTDCEVYLQYGRYFVNRGQGLLLLGQAGRQRSTMNIPSWVPDWTSSLTEGIDFADRDCNASGDMLGEPGVGDIGVCEDPRTIFAAGGRIDQITDLGPPFPQTQVSPFFQSELLGSNFMQACLDWHSESWDIFQHSSNTRYQSITERRNAFAHLLMLQRQYGPGNNGTESYFSLLKSLRTYSSTPRTLTLQRAGTGIFSIVKAMTLYPQNRRLCLTFRGYIGLAPAIAEKGDMICAIAGSKPLHVIRQQDTAYELIGDAFVFEMMKGEAVRSHDFTIERILLC